MNALHLPWLELCVLIPAVAAVAVAQRARAEVARHWSLIASALTLAVACGAYFDFHWAHVVESHDRFSLLSAAFGWNPLAIDQISAPMLPLVALLFLLTRLSTAPVKVYRFSFALSLLAEAIVLAMYASTDAWFIVALMVLSSLLPAVEIWWRGRSLRAFALYLGLSAVLLLAGQYGVSRHDGIAPRNVSAVWALALGLAIRAGLAPFHSWIPDLFERASFGTALLFTTPLVGAYGLTRLVMPAAAPEVNTWISLAAVVTALYASAMSIVQREGRAYYSYLLISNGAVVLAGLLAESHTALVGGLCTWLSVTVAIGGLGLTLRALEARRGRLRMDTFQGLYDHTPNLAACFALTGLASVGFPGTFGFIGNELLVDGSVEAQPVVGICLVAVAAMNGIAIMQAFLRLFGGAAYFSSVSLGLRRREQWAVLTLAALILVGGLFPQWIVAARNEAADELTQRVHQGAPPLAVKRLEFAPPIDQAIPPN